VITTSFLLNHVATLEASHPIHLSAEFSDRISRSRDSELILFATHPFMPLGAALEAQGQLTLWATSCPIGCNKIIIVILRSHVSKPPMSCGLHRLIRKEPIQDNEHTTSRSWAKHHRR
jgi:hypothetical protein